MNRSGRDFEVGDGRIFYSLAAHQGRRRRRRSSTSSARRGERPFRDLADFCERIDPQIVGKRALESLVAAGALDCFGSDRAAMHGRHRADDRHGRSAPRTTRCPARPTFSARPASAQPRCCCPPPSPGCRPSGCIASSRRSASTSRPIRSTNTARRWTRCGCRAGPILACGEARRNRRPAGRHGHRARRSARPEPATRWASSSFSDTSGRYEAVLFSEGLAQYRDLLEPGRSVVITVAAEDRPEGISLRIQTVEALDELASRAQKALRIFVRDAPRWPRSRRSLRSRARAKSALLIKEARRRDRGRAARPLPHLADHRIGDACGAGWSRSSWSDRQQPRRGGGQSAGRLASLAPPLPNV